MNGVAAVFYRDYRQRITNIGFVFWDMFAPIAYLLLFGVGFEKAMGGGFSLDGQALDYTSFLLPGVLAMISFSVAMNTSWGFFMDKDSGIFLELLTYPITRRQLLLGKICFNVLLSVLGSLLAILTGVLVLGAHVRWDLMPLTLCAVSVTTAGWFFLFSIFAVQMSRMDAFNTVTSVAYIFLMFISTLFYPLAGLPAWFQWAARLNPMTWQVDLLRYSLLGVGAPVWVVWQTVAFLGFAFVALGLAVRTLDQAS